MSVSIIVWSTDSCPYCTKAMQKLDSLHLTYEVRKLGSDWTKEQLLEAVPGARSVPQIIINGEAIGGYDKLLKYCEETGFNGTGSTL
jgi:glutaredoxin 3